jgi:hypothetical protein
MQFLIDEDADVAVGAFLAAAHEVRFVTQILGPGTKDPDIMRYAEVEGLVLVTGDRLLANRIRQEHRHQRRRIACLFLHGLYDAELGRTTSLISVIESEHALLGGNFWMEVGTDFYRVLR